MLFDSIRADPALAFSLSRLALVLAGLAGLAAMWRRPRPSWALGLVIALHLAAWASYVAPLGRLYGLGEHLDRSFNVGMAACTAAGNSPFEHVQVRGLYIGLRQVVGGDAWERALIVASVLGLSSLSASQQSPLPPFWTGNFLLKPNHVTAFALVGVVLGMVARRAASWKIGLVLGLLSWVFILTWSYLLPGVAAGVLLLSRRDGSSSRVTRADAAAAWRPVAVMLAISGIIALPYIVFLTRDYGAGAKTEAATQMWRDPLARAIALPHWATLDLATLLVLSAAGVWVWLDRRGALDRLLLCVLAATGAEWVAYEAGAPFGISPEPDEFHYFLRFVLALAAGSALAAFGRGLEETRRLGSGQGHLLVLAASLLISFVANWDPPSMDRYYRWSRPPLNPLIEQYGDWVRANTPSGTVFLAGRSASIWIPVLAGRRVLLTAESRPPRDYAARARTERQVMRANDPDKVMAALRQAGIGYVAVDAASRDEYGPEVLDRLRRVPGLESVFANAAVEIFKVVPQPAHD